MDVWFEAYGCTANQGETRELAERARELGHPLAESAETAATVVLGTCTVIEATPRRIERRIAELQQRGKRVVETFRARHPGLMLATDVIAGFPGESEADHRATVALLERLQPELVHVTRFSPRDGTPAAGFPQQILSRTAKERSRELTRLRLRLARRRFGRLVGSRRRVLAIAHRKPGTTFCRDDSYRPVVLGRELPPGRFATVAITGATATYLRGRLA